MYSRGDIIKGSFRSKFMISELVDGDNLSIVREHHDLVK